MSTQGSIKKEVSGRWSFVVDVPGLNGKRSQVRRRGFSTKKAAGEALAIVIAERSRGEFVRPKRGTVQQFLESVWLPTKRAKLKPSTWATYEQMLRSYVIPHIGGLEMSKVDGDTLNVLYAVLLERGRANVSARGAGLSPKTVRNIHGMLHQAFTDAKKSKRIGSNPADDAEQPRKPDIEMLVWDGDQIRTFMRSVADDRHAALWHLLFTTGMRRGELMGLRWSDVKLDQGRLTIRHTMTMVDGRPESGTPKSRAGSRTIALDPATVAALKVWHTDRGTVADGGRVVRFGPRRH